MKKLYNKIFESFRFVFVTIPTAILLLLITFIIYKRNNHEKNN
jgi:hypothetical protein